MLLIVACLGANAQSVPVEINLPAYNKIKTTTLSKVNDKNNISFKTWQPVIGEDADLMAGVSKGVDARGNEIAELSTMLLGWWHVGKESVGRIAYVYAIDEMVNGKAVTKIYVTSLLGKEKTASTDLFKLVPSPTGMKGKITVTDKVVISAKGKITATKTHKTSNGKVLTSTKNFVIDADGNLIESI